jgi:site-specific recombinase XerD
MLAQGIHPKIVQERLGHSTISVTVDLYGHVLKGMQEDAIERVDAVLQAALNKRRKR